MNAARSPITATEAGRLFDACRQRVQSQLAAELGALLDRIEGKSVPPADPEKPKPPEVPQAVRTWVFEHRGQFEPAFNTALPIRIDVLSGKPVSEIVPKDKAPVSFESLSLLEHDDLDRKLALQRVSNKILALCGEQIGPLQQRVRVLLPPDLSESDSPFDPFQICDVFDAAVSECSSDLVVQQGLLAQWEWHLGPPLEVLYADLNQLLVNAGVLPIVPLVIRKFDRSVQAVAKSNEGGGGGGAEMADAQNVSAGPAGSDSPVGSASSVSSETVVASVGFVPPEEALQLLDQLVVPDGLARAPDPELLGRMNQIQQLAPEKAVSPEVWAKLDPVRPRVLQELRADILGAEAPPLESVVFDVVSLLFDYVFDSEHIAPPLMAMISRLQIPVLKVALTDRNFFSDKQHPLRQLLEQLATACVGWQQDEPSGERLLLLVEETVDAVVNEFDQGASLFERLLDRLKAFVTQEKALAQLESEKLAQTMVRMEREALGREEVERYLAPQLDGHRVPNAVRAFLAEYWAPEMMEAYVSGGSEGPSWADVTRFVNELIWVFTPRMDPKERERQVTLVKPLVHRAKEVIARRGGDYDKMRAMLHALKDAYEVAATVRVEQEESGAPQIRRPQTPTPLNLPTQAGQAADDALVVIDTESVAGGSVAVSSLTERAYDATTSKRPTFRSLHRGDPVAKQIFSLVVGTWLEFRDEKNTLMVVQLSWVSPQKSAFMFTNRQGRNALSISAIGLAERLKSGRAREIEQRPFLERAMDSLKSRFSALLGRSE